MFEGARHVAASTHLVTDEGLHLIDWSWPMSDLLNLVAATAAAMP
jgi:hypothetical protein